MCITLNVKTLLNPKGGCMKKLVVLALVLSVASMASAALQISLNGNQALNEVTVGLGQVATVGLWTDQAIAPGSGEWFGAAITALVPATTMSGGVSMFPTETGIAIFQSAAVDLAYPVPAGEDGIGFTVTLGTISGIPANGDIVTGMSFSSLVKGDYTLTLTGSMDYVATTFQDSVIVHVTPEPMTMGLLGLGGLFLRRRSK
jgi:hypothetical protein